MKYIKEITDYVIFLKNHCYISLSLHPCKSETLISGSSLLAFNFHENSYCAYIKSFPELRQRCIDCQKKVQDKCQTGAFCGTCYAGVREYVYPISDGKSVQGFLSVSGYADKNSSLYLKKISDEQKCSFDTLNKIYCCLKTDIPTQEDVDVLINPLCRMLELAYIKSVTPAQNKKEEKIEAIIRYVKQNHMYYLTLEETAKYFNCSCSHISHLFKSKTGHSFREYITMLRLEDAKNMLTYSSLSITDIAFSIGFSDANYFSYVFKKSTALSPTEYRKASRK